MSTQSLEKSTADDRQFDYQPIPLERVSMRQKVRQAMRQTAPS
ncbi:hypothetical protein MUGA111182_07065 [Mucilaginibacter galii]|nr:hypothetical protein [Mucilaginibacter galii]